jgi:uncharacterized membrane protein (Fun14 family)
MNDKPKQPFDSRAYRQRNERALVGAIALLFLVGGGLVIGFVYGWSAVLSALLCLIPGVLIFVLLWLLLGGLERFLKSRDQ